MSKSSDFIIKNGVLKKYVGPGGDVVIPNGVKEIEDNAFNPYLYEISLKIIDGRKKVKSVVVPEGAYRISEKAFANCAYLNELVIPKSVLRIGVNAFEGTDWLKKQPDHVIVNSVYVKYKGTESQITIPEGIISIADEAFRDCKEITHVNIPEGVKYIGSFAFCGCKALADINIPKSVSEIGDHAFEHTPWIKSHTGDFVIINGILHYYQGNNTTVRIPDGVTTIGAGAFRGCKTIKSVTIPDSVTEIKKEAFWYCENLNGIQLPDGVTAIEEETFYSCSKLKQITFSKNVKTIGESAFYCCEKLSKLPDMSSVETMGELAFYGCKKLIDKDGYLIVGHTLFGYTRKNETLIIPDHVTNVSERALEKHDEVTSVVAPAAVFAQVWGQLANIEKYYVAVSCLENGTLNDTTKGYIKRNKDKIFAEIVKRDSVEMMESFLLIARNPNLDTVEKYVNAASGGVHLQAFLLNYKASRFSVEQVEKRHEEKVEMELCFKERTLKDWRDVFKLSVVDGCIRISGYKQNDTVVEIPEAMDGYPVTIIGDNVFKGNATVTDVVLPAGITSIGANAFKGCSKLKSINIPERTERLCYAAFEGCESLSCIDLPDSIKSIGGSVFKGCSSLTQIKIPNGVEYICSDLFDGCASLTTVNLPDTITKINDYAFRNCKVLASIELPKSLEIIGMGAFTNCKALTEIYLPDTVKDIELYAFRMCTKLARLRIPATVEDFKVNAFNGCKKLTICAPEGCYAANLAKTNEISFEAE